MFTKYRICKLTIASLLFLPLTVSAWWNPFGASGPEFVKNSSFGKTPKVMASRLGSLTEVPCSNWTVDWLKPKSKNLKCLLNNQTVVGGSWSTFALSDNEKIIWLKGELSYRDGSALNTTVEEFTNNESVAPKFIAKTSQQPYDVATFYMATWVWGDTTSHISALCSKVSLNGNLVEQQSFKKCFITNYQTFHRSESELKAEIKKNDIGF